MTPRERLNQLLTQSTHGDVVLGPEAQGIALVECGVDSIALLTFLVAIEQAFDIVWPVSTQEEVFTSIDSLVQFLTHGAEHAH